MNATGTTVRYYCDPDSLGDVQYDEFGACMYDALRDRWPGATVNIVQGQGRSWGETSDGQEISSELLAEIANEVFESILAE